MKIADQDIPELKRDELGKGVRGKYLKHFMQGSNVVVLQPEIQKARPSAISLTRTVTSLKVGTAGFRATTARPLSMAITR